MISKQTELLILLSKLKGVGNSTLRKILPDINKGLSFEEIAHQHPKIRNGIQQTPNYAEHLKLDLDSCSQNGVEVFSVFDIGFPSTFNETINSPLFLYTKGDQKLLLKNSLAIIGTRNPDRVATEFSKRVSKYFSCMGIPILSGLALGCDTLAHESALDSGGTAIAVLGHGLHTIAPPQNRKLADKIIDTGGLLVSEYPMGMSPTKFSYVQRDKTQAALSKAVILVQGAIDGGSIHACRASLKVGKKVFFLPPTNSEIHDMNHAVHSGSGNITILLDCMESDLVNVVPLFSKDDYLLVEKEFKNEKLI